VRRWVKRFDASKDFEKSWCHRYGEIDDEKVYQIKYKGKFPGRELRTRVNDPQEYVNELYEGSEGGDNLYKILNVELNLQIDGENYSMKDLVVRNGDGSGPADVSDIDYIRLPFSDEPSENYQGESNFSGGIFCAFPPYKNVRPADLNDVPYFFCINEGWAMVDEEIGGEFEFAGTDEEFMSRYRS